MAVVRPCLKWTLSTPMVTEPETIYSHDTRNVNEYDQKPEYSRSGKEIVFFRSQEAGGGGPGDVWKLLQSERDHHGSPPEPHPDQSATRTWRHVEAEWSMCKKREVAVPRLLSANLLPQSILNFAARGGFSPT